MNVDLFLARLDVVFSCFDKDCIFFFYLRIKSWYKLKLDFVIRGDDNGIDFGLTRD